MAVLTPIFYKGEWVGFAADMAHKSDIGGTVPGSGSGQAREIFQEGLHLPPVKLAARYKPVEEIAAMITANSRTPALVIGDIRGQVGACRLGERRLAELMERYGKETIVDATEQLSALTEARVKQALASWPDGSAEGETFVDHDGVELDKPIRIHVKVDKKGEWIRFDFTESGNQTRGPANIRPPLVRACCAYSLVTLVDPYLPVNRGITAAIETVFRPGSVLDPRFPGAVNTYMPTALAVVEAIFRALARFVPDKNVAGSSGSAAMVLGGRSSGRGYVHYEIFSGGTGARTGKDGVSAMAFHLSNCRTAPIEIIESEFPTRVERFELIPDSGGAGEFRGGLGFIREARILADDVRFSMRTDKHAVAPVGTGGGKDAATGACVVNPGSNSETRLPSRFGDYILRDGDLLRIERPGGGGLGEPCARAPGQVLDDVLQGYVSAAAAEASYGVVVKAADGSWHIDEEATFALRKREKKAGKQNRPLL
jgi:N-methylhydantoinase B